MMKNETKKGDDAALVWDERGKKTLLTTVVLTVTERDCVSSDGQEGRYIVMDAPDWVIVIPETDAGFVMVKQWRHGEKALSIEFPGGVAEAGEASDAAARRELREETGCEAEELIWLGTMNPNPAIMSNHVHVFLARKLHKVGDLSLDDDERLRCFTMPRKDVLSLMGTPACPHAIMSAAMGLYLAKNAAR